MHLRPLAFPALALIGAQMHGADTRAADRSRGPQPGWHRHGHAPDRMPILVPRVLDPAMAITDAAWNCDPGCCLLLPGALVAATSPAPRRAERPTAKSKP